jgi:hypothetical protein
MALTSWYATAQAPVPHYLRQGVGQVLITSCSAVVSGEVQAMVLAYNGTLMRRPPTPRCLRQGVES